MNHERYTSPGRRFCDSKFPWGRKKKNQNHLWSRKQLCPQPPAPWDVAGAPPTPASPRPALVTARRLPGQRDDSGSFQTGREAVTQNPGRFRLTGSQAPRHRGSRKREAWKAFCRRMGDALPHPGDGGPACWFQSRAGGRALRPGRRCHREGRDVCATLPEATSTPQRMLMGRTLSLRSLAAFQRTCLCLSPAPLELTDCILVSINTGRRLANRPMNHS